MQKAEVTKNDKLVLTRIKNTPFQHATNGKKNYITCGKVLLETEYNEKEAKEWLNNMPWEAISMICQAICYEMLNNKE